MPTCIVPGSFDPVTIGHIDIITRAAHLFDRVIVGVLQNRRKASCFPLDMRVTLLHRACEAYKLDVTIMSHDGLLADLVNRTDATAMVRGLRGVADYDYEMQFASLHQLLLPHVETVYMMQSINAVNISSGFVREVGRLGGDISAWVPPCIWDDVKKHLAGEALAESGL